MQKIFNLYKQAYTGINKTIWYLATVQFVNRVGSMLFLFLSLYLTNDLHFSLSQASFVLSMYGVGGIAGNFIGGKLADKFPYKIIMMISLISSALIIFIFIYCSKLGGTLAYYSSALLVFLYALAADAFRPSNAVAIAALSTEEDRLRSFSLVRMTINLAFAIAPAIGGILAASIGYKALFICDAVTSVAAAIFIYFKIPYVKKEVFSKKEISTSKSPYTDINYLKFVFLVMVYGTLFFQLLNTLPIYFNKNWHYSEATIGWLMALNGAIVVIVEMPLITKLSNNPSPLKFIRLGVVLLLISYLFILFSSGQIILAVFYIIAMSFSEIFAMPFMMNYAVSIAPKDKQGSYTALYSIAYAVSFIIAPIVGLRFADNFGFNAMFYLFLVLCLFCAIGFSLFARANNTNSNL